MKSPQQEETTGKRFSSPYHNSVRIVTSLGQAGGLLSRIGRLSLTKALELREH